MGEWISVKDRLPEKNGSYLCYYMRSKIRDKENWEVEQLYWEHNVWLLRCYSLTVVNTVTHWTPLPEPPKEG